MSYQIQWDKNFMNHMMLLYHTRRCPINKRGQCHHGPNCFDSHKDQPRRRPTKSYSRWNYKPTELCTLRMDNQCRNYPKNCFKCHDNDEMNYHPLTYKTMPFNDPQFDKGNGRCSRGAQCWQYHGQNDKRDRHRMVDISFQSTGITKYSKPPRVYLDWVNAKINNNHNTKQQPQQPQQPQLLNNNNNNKRQLIKIFCFFLFLCARIIYHLYQILIDIYRIPPNALEHKTVERDVNVAIIFKIEIPINVIQINKVSINLHQINAHCLQHE